MTKSEINANTQMRDAVIDRLYDISEDDKSIIIFTADMGAKALDRWRENRPNQYRDVGIAEQGMATIAAGMAKEGRKVFIYAIAPFVTTRIHEFHKLNAGIQNIPYHTIGMGAGFSYADSGPTHYTTEDISIMRTIPNMKIFSPSDSVMAARFIERACLSKSPTYHRLERATMPILTSDEEPLGNGYRELVKGERICLVSTGNMVHETVEVQKRLADMGASVGVMEIYQLKPLNGHGLKEALGKYKKLISVEEHMLNGGLGSMLSEMITDNDMPLKLKRVGIDDKLVYEYGREALHKKLGIDKDCILKTVVRNI